MRGIQLIVPEIKSATKRPKMDRTEPRIDQKDRPDLNIDLEISKIVPDIRKDANIGVESF